MPVFDRDLSRNTGRHSIERCSKLPKETPAHRLSGECFGSPGCKRILAAIPSSRQPLQRGECLLLRMGEVQAEARTAIEGHRNSKSACGRINCKNQSNLTSPGDPVRQRTGITLRCMTRHSQPGHFTGAADGGCVKDASLPCVPCLRRHPLPGRLVPKTCDQFGEIVQRSKCMEGAPKFHRPTVELPEGREATGLAQLGSFDSRTTPPKISAHDPTALLNSDDDTGTGIPSRCGSASQAG